MRRGEGTPPYGAEQIQAAILQNQTQEIQFILAGLDFELTAILPKKRNTESLPHSCRGRDSFDSNANRQPAAGPACGQPVTFSKSDAGCLHSGQVKSAGSSSPS